MVISSVQKSIVLSASTMSQADAQLRPECLVLLPDHPLAVMPTSQASSCSSAHAVWLVAFGTILWLAGLAGYLQTTQVPSTAQFWVPTRATQPTSRVFHANPMQTGNRVQVGLVASSLCYVAPNRPPPAVV